MSRLSTLLLGRPVLAQTLVAACAVLVGVGVYQWDRNVSEHKRLAALQVDASRTAARVLSNTQNSEFMGAIDLLGLIDTNIKQEARGSTEPDRGAVATTLGKVGRAIDAQCLFVVSQDGQIGSYWERDGSSASGLDMSGKPYYPLALQGKSSIYPGVNLSRVDQRALYYAAPIFSEVARATVGDGAVVACTTADALDQQLMGTADLAMLVSPLGVIYASSQPSWLGALVLEPTPEHLQNIRATRQFGSFFNGNAPRLFSLPRTADLIDLNDRRYAVATSPVAWSDPNGNWQLILMEDLTRSVATSTIWLKSIASTVLVLLLGWMGLYILHTSHAREQVNAQLRQFADRLQANIQYRTDLAQAALRLQHCDTLPDLAQVFFEQARRLLGALQGVLYVQANAGTATDLMLAGCAACAETPPARLLPGQGLLGQCALERRTQVILTPPQGCWTLRSGLGEAAPKALLLTPLMMNSTLIGVLELGLQQAPDEEAQRQAEDLFALLCNALEILRRRQPAPASAAPPPTGDTL